MGKGAREDGNERRRKNTLHSFRRFVKTTISDLGYQDFSEYFIGHSGSMYWTKKESEKAEIFRKNLTFLNVHQLERQGADIQSKIEELEELNQSFIEESSPSGLSFYSSSNRPSGSAPTKLTHLQSMLRHLILSFPSFVK